MGIDQILAAVLGFSAALLAGQFVIPYLRSQRIGQNIRNDGPKSHQSKAGTPVMGGVIFIIAAPVGTLLYCAVTGIKVNASQVTLLAFPILYATLGAIDDYRKVRTGRSLGLRAREKMALQVLFAALFMFFVSTQGRGSSIIVPFTGAELDLGIFYGIFVIFVVVGAGNGVNLTDGLDGLAAGTTTISLLGYLYIVKVYESLPNAPALSTPVLAWIGALLGFLYYNRHPAKVFMGDTGSNALGALLAAIAILTRTELVLVFMAGIPVIEALSDIAQVFSFQLFGKRILKMAPLHHHFELLGIKETAIVRAFWIAQAALALVGIFSMAYTG